MSHPLQQTVVVTGAASGIGKATALKFAGPGRHVVVGDLGFSDATQSEFAKAGIDFRICDVRRVTDIGSLVEFAVQQTTRLDVFVNNAGVGMVKQIEEITEGDWHSVIDVNLKAVFFGCQAAISVMRQQAEGGSIINVASNAGLLPRAHDPLYSISKQAVVGLTRSLALCHSKDRIRINCVCPGPVEHTEMIEENFHGRDNRQQVVRELINASPLARAWDRMIQPEEVADAIVYLTDDSARMVTGTAIAIDGGKSLGVPPAI
ncbi:MAG: SDR family oxidoreductase [Planctomycetaceae bacterium]